MNAPTIAPGKISLAIDRLNSEYPLHAGILAQWRVEESPEMGTMGIGFRNGRLCLAYSPDFVESIGMDELMGVLHHEVNHVLFGHVTHKPAEREDGQARTIAEEVTVNEWVSEPLPDTPVRLAQYPFLPENETTEERYEKLRNRANRSVDASRDTSSRGVPSCSKPNSANSAGSGSGQSGGNIGQTGNAGQPGTGGPGGAAALPSGAGSASTGSSGKRGQIGQAGTSTQGTGNSSGGPSQTGGTGQTGGTAKGSGSRPKGAGQSGGTSQPGKAGNGAGGSGTQAGGNNTRQASRPTSNGVPTTDDHSAWAEVRNDTAKAERVANMDIALAWGNLTPEERAKVQEPFVGIAKAAANETGFDDGTDIGIGTEAGNGDEPLNAAQGHILWQVVLRRHVGRILERRPVFGRLPRRFPHLVGVVPGKGRFAQKPKVMAVIDTSGSMTVSMLEAISAELGLMAKHYDVEVVECDAQIQRVYPYHPIVTVVGRGGTDFRPPFEQPFLHAHQPDLVVYFTDGFGPVPDRTPLIPVIWCIAEGGVEPTEWGAKIALSEPKIGPDVPNFGTGPDIFGESTNGIGATGPQDR